MNHMRVFLLMIFLTTLASQAQQSDTHPAPSAGGTESGDQRGTPIDVPDIIIKGSATIKLMATSFSKQSPSNTRTLSAKELDSLNNLEKQAPALLARSATPSIMSQSDSYAGLAHVSMGLFQTPDLAFSYGTRVSSVALFASADYHSSAGYASNTDYSIAGLKLGARSMQGADAGLFASSLLSASFDVRSQSYSLFGAIDSIPRRTVQQMRANFRVENTQGDYPYTAELRLASANIDQSVVAATKSREAQLGFGLELGHEWSGLFPAVVLNVDIRPMQSNTMSSNELCLRVAKSDSTYTAQAELGLNSSSNSLGQSQANFVARAQLLLPISNSMRMSVQLAHDVRQQFLSEVLHLNPYINLGSTFDLQKAAIDANVGLHYRMQSTLESSLILRYSSYSADALMSLDSVRSFLLSYRETQLVQAQAHVLWHLNTRSSLSFRATFNSASLSSGAVQPYIAPLEAVVAYRADIIDRLPLDISLGYVGARRVAENSSTELGSYICLNAGLRYFIVDNLSVHARVENLTNSSIFVYEKYRERSAFATVGLEFKF